MLSMSDKKPKPIHLDEEALRKLKLMTVEDPGLQKFASNLASGKIAPLEEGHIRSKSFLAMNEQLDIQMDQILEQIKLLATQVEQLQERKKVSEQIYMAKMTFEPVVGHSYFLYDRKGERFLSMIAPDEWGKTAKKLTFLGKVTLLADRTWKVEEVPDLNEDEEV